ncbi:hypothetical protein [Curtobacterium sp. MCBD17_040]|uniref:hypothetical protein n=1 Tax=Curtobacterium sp. MCBD17_040 TaxID=2175674 RepID=UPI000DA801FC|nr:hypothetical protein [Curtobacterium sp. MCBD17_040]WIB65279.1 hypothetical protein DEI94_17900 [Curtobacterium sp. MCBD17_040]
MSSDDNIVGYLTARFPLRRDFADSEDEYSTRPGHSYVEAAPEGTEVTVDVPNDEHVKELVAWDHAVGLFELSEFQREVTAALAKLVPDFERFLADTEGASNYRYAELWKNLHVVRPPEPGAPAEQSLALRLSVSELDAARQALLDQLTIAAAPVNYPDLIRTTTETTRLHHDAVRGAFDELLREEAVLHDETGVHLPSSPASRA